ncbi:MAG: ribose-phosphate pyrophosphokinase [Gaiellaceae bacterium]
MRRWVRSRLSRGKPAVFSGTSNAELAERIAKRLRMSLGSVEHETFANGETYCRFGESIRGADVFLVRSCSPPVNDHLVELLLMIHAARLASAHRITAVMPWFPYSRQDKKSAAREPISARLVADMLEAAGVDRVLTMDLHAGQIQGFFGIPVDHMTALPLFANHFRRRAGDGASLVAVSPDLGRVKLARRLSDALGADLAVVTKTRPRHDVSAAAEVVGAVEGKVVLMGDDMIVTGNTLISATEALLAAGALEVHAFATHALFADEALERLQASRLAEIAVTDSVRISGPTPSKLTVLSVADVLADTISNVFASRSVSAQFAGQELF